MWAQGAGPVNLVLVSRMQHLYLLEDMDDPFKKVFFFLYNLFLPCCFFLLFCSL